MKECFVEKRFALEPRLMFDAAAVDAAVDVADTASSPTPDNPDAESPPAEATDSHQSSVAEADYQGDLVVTDAHGGDQIIFIDGSLPDLETLLAHVKPQVQVVILDAQSNGLEQISHYLQGKENVETIHIVTHGSLGSVQLGSATMSADSINSDDISLLNEIGTHLSDSADVLFYGCGLTASQSGLDLLDILNVALSADVAASNNLTGSATLMGDWELETTRGIIESQPLIANDWDHLLLGNHAPTASTIPNVNMQDTGVALILAGTAFSDSDLLDVLTYSATGLPNGLTIDALTGTILGTLGSNASQVNGGVYSVTVTATDLSAATASTTFSIIVTNPAPVAVADLAITNEDASVNINVLLNDIDLDGDSLSTTSATAANGSVVINANGTITYTANANYNGIDTINYTISDSQGGQSSSVVAVTILPVVDLPTISLPALNVFTEDTAVIFSSALGTNISLGNVDGGLLVATLQVPVGDLTLASSAGVTFISGDGANDSYMQISGSVADINLAINGLIYTPGADYNGPVNLTINLGDIGLPLKVSAILPINIAPEADIVDDNVVTRENTSASFNVLANDSFENPNRAVTGYSMPSHGSVTINAAGDAIYTPNTGFTGTDTFTYTVTSNGTTETATVTVTISANHTPVTSPMSASTNEDTAVTVDVLSNASDVDGDTLTVVSASAVNGVVVINADGSLGYTPNANYHGSDVITYTLSDGHGGTTTSSVSMTVLPVNDAPISQGNTTSVQANVNTGVTNILFNSPGYSLNAFIVNSSTINLEPVQTVLLSAINEIESLNSFVDLNGSVGVLNALDGTQVQTATARILDNQSEAFKAETASSNAAYATQPSGVPSSSVAAQGDESQKQDAGTLSTDKASEADQSSQARLIEDAHDVDALEAALNSIEPFSTTGAIKVSGIHSTILELTKLKHSEFTSISRSLMG